MKLTELFLSELDSEVERSRRALEEVPPGAEGHDDALLKALDKAADDARSALRKTTDEHLMTSWRLLARAQVVMEAPRYVMIRDTINHWAHHCGQMTVYLRLMGAKVPALYGPSADDKRFL